MLFEGHLGYKIALRRPTYQCQRYSDAGWTDDVENQWSTSRYVFCVGEEVVSWNSKRQQTVAQSTMEAECMTMNRCMREAIWLRQLMEDVSYVQEEATTKVLWQYLKPNQS